MSRTEQIVEQVKSLNADELKDFRDWFARYDADVWDQQIEVDAKNGKLISLSERAVNDHEAGRSTEL